MAVSRVEKFKEYRKSIISNGSELEKTKIDTNLKSTSADKNEDVDLTLEYELCSRLKLRKTVGYTFVGILILAVVVLLIIYGIRLF